RPPARTAVALVLGTLAVAFGAYVVTFNATYRSAKSADAAAAFGSDLHLVGSVDPYAPDVQTALPPLGPGISTSPIRLIPARAGTDRKTIMALDPITYQEAITAKPQMVSGQGVDALAHDPTGILVSSEIARDFAVKPGDPLPLTVFPDDQDKSRNVTYQVLGEFRSVPPSNSPAEMVMNVHGLPSPALPPPDFYLARINGGSPPSAVAERLRSGSVGHSFAVLTPAALAYSAPRSLTALNLGGLSTIEAVGAGLIAAVGVAILGAFLVLERRRELAVLQAVGADRRQQLTGPVQEGALAVAGSLAIGIPLGLLLGLIAVRVLGLFFTLPPPLLTVPIGQLALFGGAMVLASGLAFALALRRVRSVRAATVLREP
ncbi:MAG: ABC transporter permease, partial [Solirubrobacterales bacterium]